MKYIEFLGLPGAGKTTLAAQAVTILQAQPRTVYTKLEARQAVMRTMIRNKPGMLWRCVSMTAELVGYRMWNLLWEKHQTGFLINFLCEHPALIRQIVEAANRLNPPALIPRQLFSNTHLVHWILDAAMVYQAAHEYLKPDEILLQEEGFCQQAYYLLAAFRNNGSKPEVLERYVQQIPRPHLLIVIATDPEQCEARMQQRTKGVSSDILRFLPVSERVAVLKERSMVYEEIAEYLEARQVPVVRLDNQHYHTSCQRLEAALAQC